MAWPNGWEGGYVHGHDEVQQYWTRQWQEVDPTVTPVAFTKLADGRLQITVHQFATSVASGEVVFDGNLLHIYEFEHDVIKKMVIQKELYQQRSASGRALKQKSVTITDDAFLYFDLLLS